MQAPASASPSTPDTDDTEHTLFEGHPAMVPNLLTLLVTVLTLGLALLYLWVRTRGTHYRITNQRVIIERGLFSKRMDQVDTYRINESNLTVTQRPLASGKVASYLQDAPSRANLASMPATWHPWF